MSLSTNVDPLFTVLPNVRTYLPLRHINMSLPQKITVFSVTLGVALIGFLARYLRRRRTNERRLRPRGINATMQGIKSPNGELGPSGRRSASPGMRHLVRQGSMLSDRLSMSSGWLAGGTPASSVVGENTAHLTPQQFGVMGMEALETAVNYWEDALMSYKMRQGDTTAPLALTSAEEAEFSNELHTLLDAAYDLQNQCELLFLDQRSVLFRTESSARHGRGDAGTVITSTPESFVSAQDEVADLREFEEFAEEIPDLDQLPLYQAAQKQYDEFGVPCRVLRTEIVHCQSDIEFLCKLHCVRLGCQFLFRQDSIWLWLSDAGRQVLTNLLLYADKDPKDLLVAYEEMLDFLHDQSNWTSMEQELLLKGVKALTFYDMVMDFILMDAFEELEQPPSSVTAVVQNRWLSNGFKETALTTAVWSVLKAKRRMLKFPNGFMAHFYSISEQMSPLMAWGFLGPDNNLREICQYFKDQMLGFLMDIFSFHKTRYTNIDEMSTDMLTHLRTRVEAISTHMAQHQIQS